MARGGGVMKIEFEDNSNEILGEWGHKKNKILTAIGLKAVEIWGKIITSKKIVDTGRFRNSINYQADNDSVTIGSGVEYAEWLEIGTKRMPARPSLKPTIEEYKDSYKNITEQIMKE